MDAMGPETAEFLKQSPMYADYQRIAPRVEDWPVLVRQLVEAIQIDYDWSLCNLPPGPTDRSYRNGRPSRSCTERTASANTSPANRPARPRRATRPR